MSTEKKNEGTKSNTLSLFDHVKHIRQEQDPNYYINLSDEDKKSFNPFMIIRALSMDEYLVEEMSILYSIFDKIPPAQLYTLLIALVPISKKFYPWIKTKIKKHNKELVSVVASKFKIPKYQANTYVDILSKENNGELKSICISMGLQDSEINKLLENKNE